MPHLRPVSLCVSVFSALLGFASAERPSRPTPTAVERFLFLGSSKVFLIFNPRFPYHVSVGVTGSAPARRTRSRAAHTCTHSNHAICMAARRRFVGRTNPKIRTPAGGRCGHTTMPRPQPAAIARSLEGASGAERSAPRAWGRGSQGAAPSSRQRRARTPPTARRTGPGAPPTPLGRTPCRPRSGGTRRGPPLPPVGRVPRRFRTGSMQGS